MNPEKVAKLETDGWVVQSAFPHEWGECDKVDAPNHVIIKSMATIEANLMDDRQW